MVVTGPEPEEVEDGRIVQLRHRSEPTEFPAVLHEGEIAPAKGKDVGGKLHFVSVQCSVTMLHGGARNEEAKSFF